MGVLTHTLLDITDILMLLPSLLQLKSLLLRLKPERSVKLMPKLTQLSLLLPPLSHPALTYSLPYATHGAYAGYGYPYAHGLGYATHGYSNLGYAGLGYNGLGYYGR